MHGSSRPGTMRMPPQCSNLIRYQNFLSELWSWPYRTLSYVFWSIPPWIPWLLHSVPNHTLYIYISSSKFTFDEDKMKIKNLYLKKQQSFYISQSLSHHQELEEKRRNTEWVSEYQWSEMLSLDSLKTSTVIVSPCRTCRVGPGNWSFTVKIFLLLHNLLHRVSFTCTCKYKLIITSQKPYIYIW